MKSEDEELPLYRVEERKGDDGSIYFVVTERNQEFGLFPSKAYFYYTVVGKASQYTNLCKAIQAKELLLKQKEYRDHRRVVG